MVEMFSEAKERDELPEALVLLERGLGELLRNEVTRRLAVSLLAIGLAVLADQDPAGAVADFDEAVATALVGYDLEDALGALVAETEWWLRETAAPDDADGGE